MKAMDIDKLSCLITFRKLSVLIQSRPAQFILTKNDFHNQKKDLFMSHVDTEWTQKSNIHGK